MCVVGRSCGTWGAAVVPSCRSRPDASVAAPHPPRVRSPGAGLSGTAAAAPPGAQSKTAEMHGSGEPAPVRRGGSPGEGPGPGPLRRFRATQGRALARAVERLLLGADVGRDAGELLGDDRPRDDGATTARRRVACGVRAAGSEPLVEGADLGGVLDGAHGGVAEGRRTPASRQLQVPVAVLRARAHAPRGASSRRRCPRRARAGRRGRSRGPSGSAGCRRPRARSWTRPCGRRPGSTAGAARDAARAGRRDEHRDEHRGERRGEPLGLVAQEGELLAERPPPQLHTRARAGGGRRGRSRCTACTARADR